MLRSIRELGSAPGAAQAPLPARLVPILEGNEAMLLENVSLQRQLIGALDRLEEQSDFAANEALRMFKLGDPRALHKPTGSKHVGDRGDFALV